MKLHRRVDHVLKLDAVELTLPPCGIGPGGIGSDVRVGCDGAFRWLFDPYGLGSSGRIVPDD